VSDTLGRVFAVVDELVFVDANAKDATAIQGYKHIAGIDKVGLEEERRRGKGGDEKRTGEVIEKDLNVSHSNIFLFFFFLL